MDEFVDFFHYDIESGGATSFKKKLKPDIAVTIPVFYQKSNLKLPKSPPKLCFSSFYSYHNLFFRK